MVNRQILEIEIDDSAFQDFMQKFNEHKEVMKALPSYWTAAGQEVEKQKTNFERISAKLAATGDASTIVEKAQDGVGKLLDGAAVSLGLIGTQGKLFASNIVRSTQSLMKWTKLTSVFAGVIGAGGLFGIDRMAASVAGQRASAMGLGVSYGEQASFLTNFRRLGNPEAILKGFSEGLSTPVGKAQIAHLIGHQPTGDAAEAAVEALPKFKDFVERTPDEQLEPRLEALGYTKLGLGVEQARAIRGIPREEIEERVKGYREGRTENALGLDPATAQKWVDFTTQMESAGRELEKVFGENLKTLIPGLTDLSNAFIHLVENLLKDGSPIKGWIDRLGDGIDSLAKSMGSRGFKQGVSNVLRDSTALIHAVERITHMSLKDIFAGMQRGMDASRADIEQRYGKDWNAFSGVKDTFLEGAKPADPSDYKITSTKPGGTEPQTQTPQEQNRPGRPEDVYKPGGGQLTKHQKEAAESGGTPPTKQSFGQPTPSQNERAAIEGARTQTPGGPGSQSSPLQRVSDKSQGLPTPEAGEIGTIADSASALAGRKIQSGEVQQYISETGRGHPSSLWCADFVGAALDHAGYSSLHTRMATDYLKFGAPVGWKDIKRGDVIVEGRHKTAPHQGASGHVGIAAGPPELRRGKWVLPEISGDYGDHVEIHDYADPGTAQIRRPVERKREKQVSLGKHPAEVALRHRKPEIEIALEGPGSWSVA